MRINPTCFYLERIVGRNNYNLQILHPQSETKPADDLVCLLRYMIPFARILP